VVVGTRYIAHRRHATFLFALAQVLIYFASEPRTGATERDGAPPNPRCANIESLVDLFLDCWRVRVVLVISSTRLSHRVRGYPKS
jgi:hypothetical protein